MLLSSDVIAVYKHIPHITNPNKAIKIYKMNFIVTSKLYSSNNHLYMYFVSFNLPFARFTAAALFGSVSPYRDYSIAHMDRDYKGFIKIYKE